MAKRQMSTQNDVRRIALSLPATEETAGRFAFSVQGKGTAKGFVWVWMERVTPKKPRVANDGVLAVRVAGLAQRELMIAADPSKFFTEPHYEGFPAVLVRLHEVTVEDLEMLIADAWRCQASPEVLKRATDGPPIGVAKRASARRSTGVAKRPTRKPSTKVSKRATTKR